MRLARLAHPTFWSWLEEERSGGETAPPPFELTALLNSFDVPLAPSRERVVRAYIERSGVSGAPVKIVRERADEHVG
jgi:hypothetical protein